MKEKLKPKIFKNKVGRPSNEILNKRKKIIITFKKNRVLVLN